MQIFSLADDKFRRMGTWYYKSHLHIKGRLIQSRFSRSHEAIRQQKRKTPVFGYRVFPLKDMYII